MGVREKYAHLPLLEKPFQLRGITALFACHQVRLVYLFGSAACVPEKAEDIDLAFFPAPGFRFQPFYAELSEALGTDRLDLVELTQAPLWLREEILRTGICLYEREPGERIRWEAATRALVREGGLQTLQKKEEAMGLNRAFIAAALEELQRVSAELAKYLTVTLPEVETNLSLRWTVERGLLAGLTLMFQVADHILAEHFGRKPETYEALLRELCTAGIIPQSLYASLRGAGGFRNVLVHEYVQIDLRHVLEALQKAPEQFDTFAREVANWLEQQVEE
jgi:uncharacterized protein YutE (UPF0331/DUF86 family)/predicted nucleotidyltransferase